MIIVHDSGLIHDVVEVREARAVEVHGAGDDETHAPGQHHQDVDCGHLPVLYVLKITTKFLESFYNTYILINNIFTAPRPGRRQRRTCRG